MKKVLFIDRDGTIIKEPSTDYQVDSLEKFEFIPGAISTLQKIASELDFELVLVTNQDGLGTESFPEDAFWPYQEFMIRTLQNEGVHFQGVHIDKSFEHENNPNRKPGTGMLGEYLGGSYDLINSYVIGDRETDVLLAQNLESKSIHFSDSPHKEATFSTTNWEQIYQYLKSGGQRKSEIQRNTSETKITVSLNLDGTGKSEIDTGLGFFDHMLEQVAKHGSCDLKVLTKGDLHIDEHHTIEDTALALGEAFLKALGDKKGINRYGFLLPMDEAQAQVAIDFGGRPWLVWEAEFNREKIGEMPTEMFYHFFKSFSDAAKCNLNISVTGTNEHHKIEAIFKAFAKSIKMAVKRDGDDLPTTKGVL